MDATHFVLLCAVFVLVATWMQTTANRSDACYQQAGSPLVRQCVHRLAANAVFGRMGETSSVRLTLRQSGTRIAEKFAGLTRGSGVLRIATGKCQQIDATPRGQD